MKVILLCDVKGTGKKDDVLNVSDGFARNYLFPRKWAVEATPGAVKEIERKRANEERLERERQRGASGARAPRGRPEAGRQPARQGHYPQGQVRVPGPPLRQHHQPGDRRGPEGAARCGCGQTQDRMRAHPSGWRRGHHRVALLRRNHPHEGFRRRGMIPRHDAAFSSRGMMPPSLRRGWCVSFAVPVTATAA